MVGRAFIYLFFFVFLFFLFLPNFHIYLICCQCFKSTKGNSLLSTKAYGIFVQSTIKGISL